MMLKNYKFNSSTIFYTLLLLLLFEKVFVAFFSFNTSQEVISLSFQNGGYIKSLLESFEYKNEVAPGIFFYGHRMPGLPFFVSLLSMISKKQIIVSILKSIVYTFFFYIFSKKLVQINGVNFLRVINSYLLILVIFPNLIKETIELNYEDAFIFEVISLLVFYLISDYNKDKISKAMPVILSLGFLSFFFKSSMIVLFFYSILFCSFYVFKYGISVINKSSLLTFIIISSLLLLWARHNKKHRDVFTVLTSYKGENFYNGANEENYIIYPYYVVDVLYFGKDTLKLPNHKFLAVTEKPEKYEFQNEQDWSNFYQAKGIDWIRNNPLKYLDFTRKKIIHFFGSINPYPLIEYPIKPQKKFRNIFLIFSKIWLVTGRLISFILLIYLFKMILKKNTKIINYILIIGSYSLPYLIGYSHTRHINIFIIISIIVLMKIYRFREIENVLE